MVCILIEETENLRKPRIYYEQECRVEMASIAIDEEIADSPSESPNSAYQLDPTGLSLNTTALDQAVDSMLL